MKPSPNAAPIRPMPRARSSGGVVSAITAWAVAMLPPQMPASRREANSMASESASANRTKPTTEPMSEISSTGRRPTRSERRPRIGEKTNCIAEYVAMSSPNTQGAGW